MHASYVQFFLLSHIFHVLATLACIIVGFHIASIQALYELAFGFGSISGLFFIYTLRPCNQVPCDVNICDVGQPPQVLFVEENDDGVDLFSFEKVQITPCTIVLYLP